MGVDLIALARSYFDQQETERRIDALKQRIYANFTLKEEVGVRFEAVEGKATKLSTEISQLRGVVNRHQNEFPVLYESMAQVKKDARDKVDFSDIKKIER